MKTKKTSSYFWTAVVAFWIPIILAAYSLKLVWPVVGRLSSPIARLLPFHSTVGEIFDFIIGILIIIIASILLGWIAQKTIIKRWTKKVDTLLSRVIPAYSFYKNFLAESPVGEQNSWESVIVKDEDEYKLGFVVEEQSDGFCSVYIPSVPNPYSGEMIFKHKSQLKRLDITFPEAIKTIRRYGRDFPVTNLSSTINGNSDK